MKYRAWMGLTTIALVLAVGAFLVACNEKTDEPKVSPNLLHVSAIDPSSLCVDGDGEAIDEDGDGTIQADEYFFADVLASFTLSSDLRGSGASSGFTDVVLTEYTVAYDMRNQANPPRLQRGLTVEIPTNGSATVELLMVAADAIPVDFPPGARGTAIVRFEGADVSGEPVRTSARLGLQSVNICK